MAISKSAVEHFTPSSAELQPFHQIHCQESDCKAIFTNFGNYDLHLQKHHKIHPQRTTTKNGALRMYHCPESGCVYNWKTGTTGRHFKHMKNLRQHFQKVHVKSYICEYCGRAFPTQGQFQKHTEYACGKRFNCKTCGWDFETKESLALHGKRKGHKTQIETTTTTEMNGNIVLAKKLTRKRKAQITGEISNCLKKSEVLRLQNKDTQTDALPPCSDTLTDANIQCGGQTQDCETQTEHNVAASLMSNVSIFESDWHAIYQDTETQTDTRNALEDFHQALQHHDIETQTETILQQRYHRHISPIISNSSNSGGGFLDHMLSHTPLTHMHTQTCEDYLLSELGLTDIQTQTNWSAFNDSNSAREYNKHMYATTSTSTSTGFAHDELLVSTETQTSFTQCLLDSTADSCTISSENATTCNTGCGREDESNTSNYVHLYNTQHTQTCDLLLEGLFGGQENDLIAGFQSTYTQT